MKKVTCAKSRSKKSTAKLPRVGSRIRIRGGTAPSGTRWVHIRQGRKEVWVKYSSFMIDLAGIKEKLAAVDIIILAGEDWNAFMADLKELNKFPSRNLVEHPGWSGNCFALQSGQVFAPTGSRGICVFQPDPGKCVQSGTLAGWLEKVAAPLSGQMLAMFMLMFMFVAPLLRLSDRAGNFGFELVGEEGKGKSMLLKLMASVIGGAVDQGANRYWSSCKMTANAIEKKAEAHSDLPLLLDDATSFAGSESGSQRGRIFKDFVFDLSQGETKHRWNGNGQRAYRTAYAITSNQSIAEVIAEIAEKEQGATKDRHLSFNTDLQSYRTFDHLPEKYRDIRDYAADLISGMTTQFGTAMPHFLQALVDHRSRNEEALMARIKERTEAFVRKVAVDRNDGSPSRVAEAFGLVIAAGALAKHYGALPADYDCEAAGLAAYRLHLASAERLSAKERLLTYATHPGIVDMDALDLKHITNAQLRDAPGFYRTHRDGEREFLVDPAAFKAAFPDHKAVLRDPEVQRLMRRDGRHLGPKRELRSGHPNDRFHCFILPRKKPVKA